MFNRFWRSFRRNKKKISKGSVDPDEIFLDSSNMPLFDRDMFEGRIETPITKPHLLVLKYLFFVLALVYVGRATYLQVWSGELYGAKAATNNLRKEVIFAHRGIITDRLDVPLAWNSEGSTTDRYDRRLYTELNGFANILGFVKYPGQDKAGNFYNYAITGQDGVEKYYDEKLAGINGAKLSEVSVKGVVESQSTLQPPENGGKLALSIDSRVQDALYRSISDAAERSGFKGGAGVIMDAKTGEVLAAVSYPTYDSNVMTEGSDKDKIRGYRESKRQPFLDRVASGLYAPGSIVKPFIALAVLVENIIDPLKQIFTVGYLSLPNPYDPAHPSIFKDWKDHGYVDMREAIAVSSDVYFYIVGGGFEGQKGLGIKKIDDYMTKFLFGVPIDGFFAGPAGTIPTPEWKKANFNGDDWRIGNTYHTSIGQYGFQVTPLQIARSVTLIATEGTIVSPTILKGEQGSTTIIADATHRQYQIVKEGMRLAVTDQTAIALNIPGLAVAAKTGTAQIGVNNEKVNSWVEGFFPYENPRYVFVLLLESGPTTYAVSSMRAMSETLTWMRDNTPEYTN